MGVTGLLPQLKDIQEQVSLESFRGKTVAIDSYAWLHKSVMPCAWELARGEPTQRYIEYFRTKIMMLRHFGVTPYFVFDGDNFSSKGNTEDEREQSRQQKKQMAMDLLERGDKTGAYKYILQSIDITPQMAKSVIEYLIREDIKFVVAPYEADAQMVYLEKLGLVDAIISEDSDLLVFGAQCLLTKLDKFGSCICIRRENFKKCRTAPIGLLNDAQIRIVACLSGCDYTPGIPGVGIVTAFKLVKRMNSMEKCLMDLALSGTKVPEKFRQEFEIANLSFQFQRVFDPVTDSMTTLNEIPTHVLENALLTGCIGPLYDLDLHRGIAHGDVDPISKEPLIGREAYISTRAVPQPAPQARPSYKTHALPTNMSSRKRSQTSPGRLMKPPIKSIDQFFKIGSAKKATPKPTPVKNTAWDEVSSKSFGDLSESKLSPTSKRRRMFHSTELKTPLTSSKFFLKKSQDPEALQTPLEAKAMRLSVSQPAATPSSTSILHDLHSSEFELSDPDNDDLVEDETPSSIRGTQCTPPELESGSESASKSGHAGSVDQSNPENDDSLDGESIVETSPTLPRRIVGATVVPTPAAPPSSVSLVAKGLFQKYGFRSLSSTSETVSATRPTEKRTPLHPVGNRENTLGYLSRSPSSKSVLRRGVTTIKTKRGVSRHFTLDSFAYRG